MDITDFLERPVAFHRAFVAMGVGITGALMLSQALYWSKRTNDGSVWFYKTQQEWEEETGLTRYEQETARAKLIEMGVLEEEKRGVPCKLFFRVCREGLAAVLHGGITLTSMRESRKLACGIPADKPELNHQTISTETTAETTAETTIPEPSAAQPGTALEVAKPAKAAKPKKQPKPPMTTEQETAHQFACRETWNAYCDAYNIRYGAKPIRNQQVNSQVRALVLRLGQLEAPGVARFYVERVNDRYILQNFHPMGLLLKSCEGYRTQWATNRTITATQAQQADKTAANYDTAEEALAILQRRKQGGSHAAA